MSLHFTHADFECKLMLAKTHLCFQLALEALESLLVVQDFLAQLLLAFHICLQQLVQSSAAFCLDAHQASVSLGMNCWN